MTEPLIDPDCRNGKHLSCVGGPCECRCHALIKATRALKLIREDAQSDASKLDAAPFSAFSVGTNFGNLYAMVDALAGVLQDHLNDCPGGNDHAH